MADTITFRTECDGGRAKHMQRLFEGWPDPLSPEEHRAVRRGSDHVVLALDSAGDGVGFATALSD